MKNILNRKNLFKTNSAALVLIILAILVVINLISFNHFGRIDLTEEQQFSISQASKNTLNQIDDPLYIKAYFSEDLPPVYEQITQYVKDILAEYKAYSDNVTLEFIDPLKDKEIEKEVASLGIPKVPLSTLKKEEQKIQNIYLGIGLFYEDKKVAIPLIDQSANIEYDLTSRIKKLLADETKVVGFLTGHKEHQLVENYFSSAEQSEAADYTLIKQALDKNYRVITVDTSEGKAIEGVDTLIIAGPQEKLSQRDLYEIDQFIIRGGKAIFLIDQSNIVPPLQAQPNQAGLNELISHYGVQINQDLVYDFQYNEMVGFSQGNIRFNVPYPLWPVLIKDNFEQQNPIMTRLQSLVLPWVSSLTILPQEGIETTILASTTENSGKIVSPYNLDPQQNFRLLDSEKTSIPIIAMASGNFSSYFSGQEAPEVVLAETDPDKELSLPQEDTTKPTTINKAENPTQILVIGNSSFISDAYNSGATENLAFFLNAVDYFTLDSDLISIRAKTIKNRPLKKIDQTTKTSIWVINVIALPLIIIIIGIAKFYLRRKNK